MPECTFGRASALSSEYGKSLGGFVSDADAYLHRAKRKQRKIVQSFCEREGWHYFHSIRKAVDVGFHDLDRRARDHEIYKIVLFLEIEAGCRDPFVIKEYGLAWKGKERVPSPSPTAQ